MKSVWVLRVLSGLLTASSAFALVYLFYQISTHHLPLNKPLLCRIIFGVVVLGCMITWFVLLILKKRVAIVLSSIVLFSPLLPLVGSIIEICFFREINPEKFKYAMALANLIQLLIYGLFLWYWWLPKSREIIRYWEQQNVSKI